MLIERVSSRITQVVSSFCYKPGESRQSDFQLPGKGQKIWSFGPKSHRPEVTWTILYHHKHTSWYYLWPQYEPWSPLPGGFRLEKCHFWKNYVFFSHSQGSQEGEGDDKGHMWPRLGATYGNLSRYSFREKHLFPFCGTWKGGSHLFPWKGRFFICLWPIGQTSELWAQ